MGTCRRFSDIAGKMINKDLRFVRKGLDTRRIAWVYEIEETGHVE